mmetsp:Transcript_2681/g.7871  ORF Transcript_2681/g.7871 Transcript_2681/m.7871 type:complete len:132 (+) Transcript_2681:345-740(+)
MASDGVVPILFSARPPTGAAHPVAARPVQFEWADAPASPAPSELRTPGGSPGIISGVSLFSYESCDFTPPRPLSKRRKIELDWSDVEAAARCTKASYSSHSSTVSPDPSTERPDSTGSVHDELLSILWPDA